MLALLLALAWFEVGEPRARNFGEARSFPVDMTWFERCTPALAPFLARILICAIIVQGALGKIFGWSSQIAYMQSHGIGFTAPLLAAALVIEAVGGIRPLGRGASLTRRAAVISFLPVSGPRPAARVFSASLVTPTLPPPPFGLAPP